MASRRGFLKLAGAAGLGAGGAYTYLETDLVDDAERAVVGPPPTENKTGSFAEDSQYAVIKRVELYESGAAVVTFADKLRCYEKFGVTHKSGDVLDQSYRRWETPNGPGSTTIGLKSVLQANGPYPSRRFKVEVMNQYFTEEDAVPCVEGSGAKALAFTVPQSWLAET